MCVVCTTAPRPERESPRPQQPLADAEAADEPRWGVPSGGGSSFSRSKRPRTSVCTAEASTCNRHAIRVDES